MFVKHGNEVADGYIYTCAIAACASVSLQENALLLLEELAATWLQLERGAPKRVSGWTRSHGKSHVRHVSFGNRALHTIRLGIMSNSKWFNPNSMQLM